jgi:phosphopantothenoylcysteine decarboxylase/phosphopantothenate--cysteine ligase
VKFKKAIVTSGGTREWIDPVRYISNASSGKMGFHLAENISNWIDDTVYIYGNVLEKYANFHGRSKSVETTIDMLNAILEEISQDTLIVMAAAPADFKPQEYSETKIKKTDQEYLIKLINNPDILHTISQIIEEKTISGVHRVGFAAETNDLESNAMKKISNKKLDYIIGNTVGRNIGFGENESSIKIFSSNGLEAQFESLTKEVLAKEIVIFLKNKFNS